MLRQAVPQHERKIITLLSPVTYRRLIYICYTLESSWLREIPYSFPLICTQNQL
jgi:hypothetical protein